MDLELLHGWEASTPAFKLAILMAIAGAYVLFELILMALKHRAAHSEAAPAELAQLAIEAYRPVSSWTRPK